MAMRPARLARYGNATGAYKETQAQAASLRGRSSFFAE